MESALAPEVRAFITRHIVSIEELEVLLLLHDFRDRDWSAAEVNDRLRSHEPSIAKWLETLVASALIRAEGGRYRIAPPAEELDREITAVAEAYRTRRTKVIEFIFSKPNENLLSFVRAFDLRKRP